MFLQVLRRSLSSTTLPTSPIASVLCSSCLRQFAIRHAPNAANSTAANESNKRLKHHNNAAASSSPSPSPASSSASSLPSPSTSPSTSSPLSSSSSSSSASSFSSDLPLNVQRFPPLPPLPRSADPAFIDIEATVLKDRPNPPSMYDRPGRSDDWKLVWYAIPFCTFLLVATWGLAKFHQPQFTTQPLGKKQSLQEQLDKLALANAQLQTDDTAQESGQTSSATLSKKFDLESELQNMHKRATFENDYEMKRIPRPMAVALEEERQWQARKEAKAAAERKEAQHKLN